MDIDMGSVMAMAMDTDTVMDTVVGHQAWMCNMGIDV